MKKYALVGSGGRAAMFVNPIGSEYKNQATLVGICDKSATRMEFYRRRLKEEYGYEDVPTYAVERFDEMIDEQKPDTVIVCTVDAFHHEYIVRALDLGCDVICEKPIAIDAEKCRQILDAVKRTGRNVRVTFNYRWSPGVTKVCELLRAGTIGEIRHVSLDYRLDTSHGADYFRRWHSSMKQSGGLLVHKSTHHFDLVNWWLDSIPGQVFGRGKLAFYGKDNAVKRGDEALTRYDRYTGTDSEGDPFRLTLDSRDNLRELYLNAEADSGYLRDQNVFRDGIDIYDTMSVLVDYQSGVTLNYSLNAFCPDEGFRVMFTGDRGSILYHESHGSHIIYGQSDQELSAEQSQEHGKRLRVIPMFGKSYEVEIVELAGGHGGGDPLIQEQMFAENPPQDPWGRNAGFEQGIASAIIGIAANESIASGKPVRVSDLVGLPPKAAKLSDLV